MGTRRAPLNPFSLVPEREDGLPVRSSCRQRSSLSSALRRAPCRDSQSPERKIPRSIYEDARDTARALVGTKTFEQSRRDRKRVEMLFVHLKRILKPGRLRLRGPHAAQREFMLAAFAQNLRRLARAAQDRRLRPRLTCPCRRRG
ncbi:MAG TPA: transposase [Gemmatimonadaceae bacterium]|nr:transposase [Gemmatimonadaceae bacterium]